MVHITLNITNDRIIDGKFPSKELEDMDIKVSIFNKLLATERVRLDFDVEDNEDIYSTIFELGRLVHSYQQKS